MFVKTNKEKETMESLVAVVFFCFLGGVAIWIFRMWLSELKSWPSYRADYHKHMKALMMGESERGSVISSMMPLSIAMINILIGGFLWLCFGYVSIAGLALTTIYIFF